MILLIVIFITALNLNRAFAFSAAKREEPDLMDTNHQVLVRKFDPEAEILAKYLAKHNSPLEYHAQDFIDAAREYGLDWKLVPAIAGVESTFGKFTPGGFNGWGWGVYGTQAIYFKSWREGIYTVSKGLREDYVNRGLTEPYSMNRRYAASPRWGGKVVFFMNEIEKFAETVDRPVADVTQSKLKIAAVSGQLVF